MFQGGPAICVFTPQGTDPLVKQEVGVKGRVKRVFDQELKGYSLICDGGPLTRVDIPKSTSRKGLNLTHPFLAIQMELPPSSDPISIELIISDSQNARRRLVFSCGFRTFNVSPLHAQIPLIAAYHSSPEMKHFQHTIPRGQWHVLCFDFREIVASLFPTAVFRALESVSFVGHCKLRQIFTLRDPPLNSDSDAHYPNGQPIPRQFQMPAHWAECKTIFYNIPKLQEFVKELHPDPSTTTQRKTQTRRDPSKTLSKTSTSNRALGTKTATTANKPPVSSSPYSSPSRRSPSARSTPLSSSGDAHEIEEEEEEYIPSSRSPARRNEPSPGRRGSNGLGTDLVSPGVRSKASRASPSSRRASEPRATPYSSDEEEYDTQHRESMRRFSHQLDSECEKLQVKVPATPVRGGMASSESPSPERYSARRSQPPSSVKEGARSVKSHGNRTPLRSRYDHDDDDDGDQLGDNDSFSLGGDGGGQDENASDQDSQQGQELGSGDELDPTSDNETMEQLTSRFVKSSISKALGDDEASEDEGEVDDNHVDEDEDDLGELSMPLEAEKTTKTEPDEESELELLFDPILNCYFDPKTNKYYQMKN